MSPSSEDVAALEERLSSDRKALRTYIERAERRDAEVTAFIREVLNTAGFVSDEARRLLAN